MITTDIQAYEAFPTLHHWFNKLWLSEYLGYNCGPAGIAPVESNYYIVRPIMNLAGMSIGAEKKWIEGGDNKSVKPGYFWCEWFTGEQLSVDYKWDNKWIPLSGWRAYVDVDNLYKFNRWEKVYEYPKLSGRFNELAYNNVNVINVEFINGKPIEVHLRPSPDPSYDELIPIWQGEEKKVEYLKQLGYTYIDSYDDGESYLLQPRQGFMVKNNKR